MRLFPVIFAIMLVTGCNDLDAQRDKGKSKSNTPTPADLEYAKRNKMLDDLENEKDPLKRAQKELELLRLDRSIAERERNAKEVEIGAKEKEITTLKLDALQTNLYIGAGALFVIAIILLALGFYFKSAHMLYAACGAAGLSSLALFGGFLTPYIFWIGGGALVLFIGFLCYLLFGRDKAMMQLTKGCSELKKIVPKEFKAIMRENIDTAQDAIIDATRKRWKDPEV